MEGIQGILSRSLDVSGRTYKPAADPREEEQRRVDSLNAGEGDLHLEDGYNCSRCNNKGYWAVIKDLGGNHFSHSVIDCKCQETRRSILRMKQSGLKNIIRDYTLDKFEVTESWQQAIKAAAEQYAKNPEGWFFIGGQSGAGKTHICTAICREFLLGGRSVAYMLWRDDVVKLKSVANDHEQYGKLIDRFKKAEVLYVDDLFKTGKGPDGVKQWPTAADVNVAFELFNYRYNNPDLLTIISSECTADDLLQIDEAVGGRIFERAAVFNLAPDPKRNYRLKKAVTL